MARTHYVEHAKQRYEMVPVTDADGNQLVSQVNRTTKTGRAVEMKRTKADKTRPLPNLVCERDGTEIKPGDPYKWIQPKSGPYGGVKRIRCGTCPAWQVWEYSHSLSAQLAQVSFEFWNSVRSAENADDVQTALDDAAQAVRDIADEKRDSASNIEAGFQHPTEQSEELEQIADDLDAWADEIETATIPDFPDEPEEDDEETPEELLETWREECESDLSIVDESPV
jgi:hypothetical protein